MTKTKLSLPRPSRRNVQISQLQTYESEFQPRGAGMAENHVAALADALERGGTLDRMAVWEDPDSGMLIIADGHHRLAAYRRKRWTGPVPVEVFKCDMATARLIPIRDNAKDRLPLSREDKSNWASRLVIAGGLTKAYTAAACGVSERTVAYMRRALKQLGDIDADVPGSWAEAQAMLRGDDPAEWDDDARDEWRRAIIDDADRQFGASLSHLCQRSSEAAAELLQRCAGGKLAEIADWLGYCPASDDLDINPYDDGWDESYPAPF